MSTAEAKLEGDLGRAAQILRGHDAGLDELIGLADRLKQARAMGLARKLLARARTHRNLRDRPELRTRIRQQQALCTYKDPDLPVGERLTRALEILEECESLQATTDPETLGLAGAIHKRLWEATGQMAHLERSLGYYQRGYRDGAGRDYGSAGINAAFVLDLLAARESSASRAAGVASETAVTRRQEARRIRQELLESLPRLRTDPQTEWLGKQWWFLVTVAEAHFGLGQYDAAGVWLRDARALPDVRDWEFESTAQQLAALVRLRIAGAGSGSGGAAAAVDQAVAEEEATAWNVLFDFLGDRAPGVQRAFVGKVGLALSGGGFRASLFHIGVLAYLAERDVLRSVEVLSCVSGGSIIGAHYYLEVRKLLQHKADGSGVDTEGTITRDDYIEIVQRIARDFLVGVQRNLRMRLLANPIVNLKLALLPRYSRSERMGQLFETHLFKRVNDGEGDDARYLSGLYIRPVGEPGTFKPKYDNWRRRAKVPVLVLNATALNTGHNWQFTASWMGEPPSGIDGEIDGNYRLRRMYYDEAPKRYQKFRLGHAVAASACVPGLFDPLTLDQLYPDRVIRLVDGGVHDNQGTASLLEQDCTVLLVSDASGQMAAQNRPSGGLLGVPLRSNGILMARVRQAQYHELDARRRSSLLRGLMFIHLKKDLDADPIDWAGCDDPYDASDQARPIEQRGVLTRYGIRKDVQQRLAAIRTDLDSFSDAEAYALMVSGYRMAEREFDQCIEGFPPRPDERPDWPFLAVEPWMTPGPEEHTRLMQLLQVARYPALKIWRLVPALQVTGFLLLAAAAAALIWAVVVHRNFSLLRVGTVGMTVLTVVLTALLGSTIVRLARWRQTLTQMLVGAGLSLVGWFLAGSHLLFFDRWYLARGKVAPTVRQSPGPRPPEPGAPSGNGPAHRLEPVQPESLRPEARRP